MNWLWGPDLRSEIQSLHWSTLWKKPNINYLGLDLSIVELIGVDGLTVPGFAKDPLGHWSHLVGKTLQCYSVSKWAWILFLFDVEGELKKPVPCTLWCRRHVIWIWIWEDGRVEVDEVYFPQQVLLSLAFSIGWRRSRINTGWEATESGLLCLVTERSFNGRWV